ncbi:MAG: hypothetical protein AAFY57_18250 [Cyanobacteria bacterium J06642_2]
MTVLACFSLSAINDKEPQNVQVDNLDFTDFPDVSDVQYIHYPATED